METFESAGLLAPGGEAAKHLLDSILTRFLAVPAVSNLPPRRKDKTSKGRVPLVASYVPGLSRPTDLQRW